MRLEVGLIRIHHAIEPREKLLGAMVSVENDGNTVDGSNGADIVGSSNGAGDAGFLAVIGDALAGKEGGTALARLQDDRTLVIASGLQSSDDGRGRGHVDRGDGVVVVLGVLEKLQNVVTDDADSTPRVSFAVWRQWSGNLHAGFAGEDLFGSNHDSIRVGYC